MTNDLDALDRELAEAMGLKADEDGLYTVGTLRFATDAQASVIEDAPMFAPSRSLDQIHQIVEAEIERRTLGRHYASAIARMMGRPFGLSEWELLRLSAKVKARAALEVLSGLPLRARRRELRRWLRVSRAQAPSGRHRADNTRTDYPRD